MTVRSERQFLATPSERTVPPIGPDGMQSHLRRGRELRAGAFDRSLRALAGAAYTALEGAIRFARCASYGLAKRVPEDDCGPCR